jgi:DNA processing protein
MGAGPVDLDRLVQRTGLAAQAIAAQLTALEIDGHVAPMPGGRWQRRH